MKILVGIIIILLFSSFIASASAIGTKSLEFRLQDIAGKEASLEQFKGSVIFLVFWATWCATCKDELSELEALYKKYHGKGLIIIGINVDASVARVVKFLDKTHITYPLLLDSKGEAGDAYRVTGLPTAFLINREGFIRYRHAGYGKDHRTMYEIEILELLKQ
jgi:peroxiredoxin